MHRTLQRQSSPEVIVIGAGPGGLASAMLLAHSGARVKLIERSSRVGGRTSAIEAQGFRFDVGPTFFLYPRVLEEIFRTVGRELMDEVPMKRLDPQYRIQFSDGMFLDATPDIGRMEAQIRKINPADAPGFRRFLDENRTKLEKFRPFLESPFLSWLDVMKPGHLPMLPVLKPWASLDMDLKNCFKDPRLRLAFSFQSKYLGMSPYRCPSLFSILAFLEYEYGVYHPYGGCSAVSEQMALIAAELGVEIRLDEPVEQMLFEGRRCVGVRTAGGEHRADAVVVNADFAQAMHRMVPNQLRRRWTNKKIAKKQFSCSTFMLYLGIEGLYSDLPHHTIHISGDYNRNLDEIENRHVLSDDPSFYVQNAGVTDDTLAPSGCSTLYVLVPCTHQTPNVNWQVEQQRYRDLAIRQLAKAGYNNLTKRIVYEKIVTPDDWADQHQIFRGATFNLAHNLKQMLHLRPRNRFEDLDGVYLVGGGTHPGSGLPVIYESARITSRLLLQDFALDTRHLDIPPAAPRPVPAMAVTRLPNTSIAVLNATDHVSTRRDTTEV